MEKIDHSSIGKIMTHRNKSGYHPRNIKITLRRVILFAMLAIVLLTAIGAWAIHTVTRSLETIYTAYFQSLLDADIKALTLWMEDEKDHVEFWAAEPNLRDHVQDSIHLTEHSVHVLEKHDREDEELGQQTGFRIKEEIRAQPGLHDIHLLNTTQSRPAELERHVCVILLSAVECCAT